jgi:hypothetical protein
MQKYKCYSFISILALFLFLSACDDVNKQDVDKVNLYQDDKLIYTFTKTDDTKEIGILVNAVNKVKKQDGALDMPPSDYTIDFILDDQEDAHYSIWLDKDSVFIMKNSSEYVQLSSSTSERVAEVITEYRATGSSVRIIYLALAIPILIGAFMLFELRRK